MPDRWLRKWFGSGLVLRVDLEGPQVTDIGLKHLKGLTSLKWLHLGHTRVTDTGLEHLQGLLSLQRLSLGNTQVTDEGVAEFQKALPNCRIHH